MNPLRKITHLVGLDLHRYRPAINRLIWLGQYRINTVLDVGANIGQFASEIRAALPDAHIHSFEPLGDCFKALNKTMAGDKNSTTWPFALGTANESTIINRSGYSPSSSLLKMADSHKTLFPHTKETSPETITIKKLDDLIELDPTKLKKNILLKIDTQGYEDKVLAGSENFLKYVSVIFVETSYIALYESQPLFADIYKHLNQRGFKYAGALQQKLNQKTGEVIFEDSIFIRSN